MPELNATLLVPDEPGEILGLGEIDQAQIGGRTRVLAFRDGRHWYFDPDGRFSGRTEAPYTTLYRRDAQQRIEHIEAWHGNDRRAEITLGYDGRGRLASAKGSNDAEVGYAYDDAGSVMQVERRSLGTLRTLRYRHQDGLVTGIERDGRTVATIAYNARGQVQSEKTADGGTRAYTATSDGNGVTVTATEGGKPVETIRYDAALQPLQPPTESSRTCRNGGRPISDASAAASSRRNRSIGGSPVVPWMR